jgi:hypothetical protein
MRSRHPAAFNRTWDIAVREEWPEACLGRDLRLPCLFQVKAHRMLRLNFLPRSALPDAGCARAPPSATTAPLPAEPEVRSAALVPPGAINVDATQASLPQTICVRGWTATVRPSTSYTNAVKSKLLRQQGLPQADSANYELDHLIALALGGHPRKPENLWLQP